MERSSTGLDANVAGLLCYVLGWISGLVFGVLTLARIVLDFIPFIGWVISWLIAVLGLVLWIVLMVKAYQGEMYKLPWSGDFAEKRVG